MPGLDITSNRLFGPQPHATAYVCIWEIRLGSMRWTTTTSEAYIMMHAFRVFGNGYTDAFNAPAAEYATPGEPDGVCVSHQKRETS